MYSRSVFYSTLDSRPLFIHLEGLLNFPRWRRLWLGRIKAVLFHHMQEVVVLAGVPGAHDDTNF